MTDTRSSPDIVDRLRNARPWVGKLGMEAADEIERLRGVAQASTGHIENAAAGVIDWKMEVERLNRLLAVEPSRIKAAIRTGFAKHGLKAAWELVDEIADRISAVTPSPVAGEGWRDLAARVMQLEAAGAKTLTCKQVLGLIAFVRDGEGVSVSSTEGK